LCGLSKPIGFTFNLVDMRIAATAIAHKLTLVTENRKGFPMLEVTLLDPPSN
jgi:predicted nucleic acid-binding protein